MSGKRAKQIRRELKYSVEGHKDLSLLVSETSKAGERDKARVLATALIVNRRVYQHAKARIKGLPPKERAAVMEMYTSHLKGTTPSAQMVAQAPKIMPAVRDVATNRQWCGDGGALEPKKVDTVGGMGELGAPPALPTALGPPGLPEG